MTTRRTPLRRLSRQLSPARELECWRQSFEWGTDFFGDLAGVGLTWRTVKRRHIEEAWHRLGAAFMASWVGETDPKRGRRWPWAREEFGEPKP